jgi:hypothetical protein
VATGTKAAVRQFLVTVTGVRPYTGISGYFSTKSGGDVSSAVNKVYDGGVEQPDLDTAPAEAANVTVGRAYDPTRDAPTIAYLRLLVGQFTADVKVQPTDRDLVPVGSPTLDPGAVLVGLTEPTHDASSGDAARFELEFAVAQFL